jgi:uncharacterized FlaG/YvyC family protein
MQIDSLNSVKAAAAPTPVGYEPPANFKQLVTAVRELNKSESYGEERQLQFARDPGTRKLVIRIVRPNTGEVIEQIPPEHVLRAFESLEQIEKEFKK